jgi:hypothetical protein
MGMLAEDATAPRMSAMGVRPSEHRGSVSFERRSPCWVPSDWAQPHIHRSSVSDVAPYVPR